MANDKENKKAGFRLIVSVVALFAAATLFVSVCFAWFLTGNNVDGGNFQIATNSMKVEFRDTFTTTRVLDGRTDIVAEYRKDSDGVYYEYADGAFVTDETGAKRPVDITGLLPGEHVDVSLSFSAVGLKTGDDFEFDFGVDRISGDTFVYQNITYSVLGVFYMQNTSGGKQWLCDYTKNADGTTDANSPKKNVTLQSGKWSEQTKDADGCVNVKFRLAFDLEQYRAQGISQSNLLSEKNVSVGRVFLWVR